MYEGTGLKGASSLRLVDRETGNVLTKKMLDPQYFGEGITVFDEKIYQLTWREKIGFVYNKDTFEQIGTWNYDYEGWGLTHDSENLIVSDGTHIIRFLNPKDFKEVRRISVTSNGREVTRLNELEYIDGDIFCNVWTSNDVVAVDPSSGNVKAWIDLSNLLKPEDTIKKRVDVLNGIAFDGVERRLFVTGKFWPKLFEIEIVPKSFLEKKKKIKITN